MPAPLENFLREVTSGHGVLTPEMYQHFGGDAILQALRKYDPNAQFTDVEIGGGEGGSQGMGKRLDVDLTKLPKSERGMAGFDLDPSNLHDNLKQRGSVGFDDPIYGSVRNSKEFLPDKNPAWATYAPMLIAALASGGAALGAAPAMMGVAGGTAGVTGAAAGLAAGNIATGGVGTMLTSLLQKTPGMLNSIDKSGGNTQGILSALLSAGAGAAGVDPKLVSLASLASKYATRKP